MRRNAWIRKIRIEGHTDNVGDEEYNQTLSEKRAGAVERFLLEEGVPPERLDSFGFGEVRPVADNKSDAGRDFNRRVEFVIVQSQVGCRGATRFGRGRRPIDPTYANALTRSSSVAADAPLEASHKATHANALTLTQ